MTAKASGIILAIVAAAVAGGIAMASAGREAPAGPPPLGEVRPVRSGADIVLPFDGYRHPAPEINTIERATAVLARACLRRFGHDWALPAADAVDTTVHAAGGRYGILDLAEVSKRGYHAPEEPKRVPDPEPPLDALMIYSGKGAAMVDGQQVPEGGCLGEARRKLEEGVPAGLSGEQFADLDRRVYEAAQSDERVQRAMGGWRDCLAAAGYRYRDVWAANDDVRWTGPAPTPEEITVATTDVTCRAKTGLVDIWLAVETAYQRQAIKDQAGDFERLKTGMGIRLGNAARAIRGS